MAEAPGQLGRRVTSFTADDGQDIAQLAFAADGETLFFVRGGAPNRAGEIPNPTSDPAGAEQAIWMVPATGARPAVRITEGASPVPSPSGDTVVFLRRGAVWMLTRAGESAPTVAQLFKMRGSAGSLRWSPDGTRLAFVSNRGTHAFVGVYHLAQRTLTWMAPSTDRDASPVWSRDGTRVAFLREPYVRERMIFVPRREREPWSILVADARTGTARTIFTADRGMGSAHWAIVAESQLFWGAGDRIVFGWEKTGFVHLWSVPAAGGMPTQLTSGQGEVEFVSLSADGRRVYYNTNVGDRDRRHVWQVAVDGSAPVQRTRGTGIEWQPVETPGGQLCFLRSTARITAHAACSTDGTEALALAPGTVPGDFPRDRLVEPTAITLRAADGIETYGQLFLPPDLKPGQKRPAAIFLHGGSRRQMLLGWNYGSYYHHAYAFNQALALRGYVVLSLNYRSGIGYGRDFREALRYGASGGSEYGDVLAAARWLRARPEVDASKLVLWGGSYGGYLTAMGLTRNPELFAAGVDVHGVHDWNVGIQTFLPDYDRYEDPAATALAFASSPLSQVRRWRAPVLLIHGDDDRNVRFIETLTLIEALRRQRVPVEQLVLPDEVHGFLRHESWLRGYEAALEFLDRRLR